MKKKEFGVVKWFDLYRQFGFICCSDGSEIFFHASEITSPYYAYFHEGQRVSYCINTNSVRNEAVNVMVLKT